MTVRAPCGANKDRPTDRQIKIPTDQLLDRQIYRQTNTVTDTGVRDRETQDRETQGHTDM